MKLKYENNVSRANEQVKGWMEEIKGGNNQNDDIVIHIFRLYQSAPDPVFCKYI